MAADILLYQANLVPVGDDQKQHVELTRDVAQRMNSLYGDLFTMPEPYIPEVGARIMSLTEPDKKMSKSSENPNSYVLLMDKPEDILRKFKRAVTDSGSEVRRSPDKPGVSNLISIYAAATGKTLEAVEAEFEGRGYGQFKPAVGEAGGRASPAYPGKNGRTSEKQRPSGIFMPRGRGSRSRHGGAHHGHSQG